MATVYDLVSGRDYGSRTVQGNLDMAQSASLNVRTITVGNSPFNMVGEIVLLVNASGGNVVIQLPTIASAPRRWYIIKKTNMTNTVTLTATGGNTINGAFTFDITSSMSIEIVNPGSGGTDWTILTNIIAAVTSDLGILSREFRIMVGGAQDPSISRTLTEISIGTGGATGTLANGTTLGQQKTIIITNIDTPGDSYILTLASFLTASTLTFSEVGQSVNLIYTAAGWALNGGTGCETV